ncbi:MAG: glycosyltransferase family 39 protein [Candidatus Aminicenantes bacterium]|nr:glycosyltransferase family 39 protein [Candidatus Aminicenantes bacterium]
MRYITHMEIRQAAEPSSKKILIIILLLGLTVRIVGLPFGLPYLYHVDEARFAKISLHYFTGDLNPHFFHVPTLHTYLVAGIWAVYFHVGKILGIFTSVPDFMNAFEKNPTFFILLGRLLTVIMSVGTIALVYLIGRKMYNRRAGILAALFLIFAYDPNKISHYQVPDAPMVFFFMLSFLFIWYIYKRGRPWDYILAGLFAGLAMATKYGGQLLFLPLILAHVFRKVEEKKPLKDILFSLPLVLSGVSFFAGFFLACPYFLLDFPAFWKGFRWQSQHLYVSGHFGSSTSQSAWLFYLQHGFRENIGVISQFLVLGGVLLGVVRHKTREIILFSLPLVLFAIIGSWKAIAVRYMLPMIPFLVLIAGYFLDLILTKSERLAAKSHPDAHPVRKKKALISATIVLLILLPSAYRVFRFDLSLTQADTRTIALRWIEENIPEGSFIAREMYTPSISDEKYSVHYRHTLGQVTLEYLSNRRVEFVVVSDIMYSRFLSAAEEFPKQARFYQSLEEEAVPVKTFEPAWNEKLNDLHNPTIKIYRLSADPNLYFPGHFQQYAQNIVLTRTSKNRWRLRSSVAAGAVVSGKEKVKNPYIRLADSKRNEIVRLTVYEGPVPSEKGNDMTKTTRFAAPLTEWEIRLGYEYSVDDILPGFDIPGPLIKEFTFPEKIGSDNTLLHQREYLFQYAASPNQGDSKYFQIITLSQIGKSVRLYSHVFGNRLRWGESYVENPFVLVTDTEGKELARLIIFEGKVGGKTDKSSQAKNAITIPSLPKKFKVYAGFEYFHDGEHPEFSGGPTSQEVIVPEESED